MKRLSKNIIKTRNILKKIQLDNAKKNKKYPRGIPVMCYACDIYIARIYVYKRDIPSELNIKTLCNDCFDQLVKPVLEWRKK